MSPRTVQALDKFKSDAREWLFQQGVSTVLLFAIGVGLWRGIPYAMVEVKSHISEINAAHNAHVNRITESFDKDQERDNRIMESLLRRQGFTAADFGEIAEKPE